MKKLLSFLAMALLFVACQNDAGQELSNDALVSVKLNVTAQDLTTRADDATAVAGYSSALGAIQNFTTEDWAKYDLRYTLEVYAAGDNGSGTAIGNARQIKTVDSYKEVFFEVRLAPNKTYKFVVFADFVKQGEQSDLYYNTDDLRAITMMDGKMNPMDEARDAYFASKELLVKSNIEEPIVLQRPFGKVRAVTTDYEFVKNYAAPAKAVVTYYNCEVFKSFNAVNGAISTARTEAENTYEYEIGKDKLYTAGVDAENANMTLFADYLLAKPTAQSEVYFTLAVYDANGNHINSQDFNVAIPIQRNYLTTIKGNLLTETANIEVKIDHELKEGNTIDPEAKTLAVPAVSATLEGNAVTLTWDAVEGATSYFTRIAAEGNEFEETTECTKVYDNLAWETTYTFEVYAACAEENLVSNTTSYEITTEAEPVVVTYNIYLKNEDNWAEVYFYAWGEYATAGWPGEAMTKTTVEGEEYYVYNLPAEANGKTLSFLFNNNNNGKQTADFTGVVADKDYFYTNYVEPVVTETYLYLKPNENWKKDNARFAAYFFGAGETWVDATLVEGETDIYSVAAPAGYPNVIFCRMNPGATANNWNNKWNQTADLTVPTDGTNFYTVKEGTWDNGGGTWSTYTPAVVALAAPEVTVAVDVNVITLTWDAVAGAKHYTVQVDDDVVENVDETSYSFVGDYEVEYMFTIKAIAADTTKNSDSEAVVVKATTEAEPAPVYTTVAEFLAAAEDESATAPMYTLKGTITAVANTTYGNFDLTDDTGTVYIYGLMSPDGATNKYWSASKAKLGDDIVVKTIRTSFNNTPQGKNAWFVELVSPGTRAFYTVDPAAVDFASAGGEQDIEVFAYNTTAAVTATSDNDAFAVAVNGYVVTVTAAANELEQDVTGNITIKVGDLEATVVKATLAAKPASGVVEGGSDDFHTISATNTSYVSGKTTAGWNYKNCAIFKGGTSDSSPAFKMIGDASNRALCMNGKTSAVGSITSPTLTTGCGTLKFNYGLPFSDTKIKFRVDIMQNGTAVKTFTINNASATKLKLYSHEEAINVAGDFQIVFTNLSPSSSTSNKDRTAIWDVEWTGYAE